MKKHIAGALLVSLLMSLFGVLATSQSASAAEVTGEDCVSSVTDTPDGLTVEACSYSETEVDAEVESAITATIEGATQLTWMRPDKNPKMTPRAIKRAPVVRVTMRTTSAQLCRKTDGAKYVRVIGTWRNTGMQGNVKVGFPTKASYPGMIMERRPHSCKYEHAVSLWRDTTANRQKAEDQDRKIYGRVNFGGVWYIIVQSCYNDLHGNVKVLVQKAIQVKYAEDLLENVRVRGVSGGSIGMSGTKACPGGDINWSISASTFAEGFAEALLKQKVRMALTGNGSASVEAEAIAAARGNAVSKAVAKLNIVCGEDTTPSPNLLEVDTVNDVLINNTRTITVTGTVAPGHTATLFASATYGAITAGKTQTVSGNFTTQVTYRAPSEVPAGGHDQVAFTLTQDDGQQDATTTNSFVIQAPNPDPL